MIFLKGLRHFSIQKPIISNRDKFEIYSEFTNEWFSGASNCILFNEL